MIRFNKHSALIHLRGLVSYHDNMVGKPCPYCKRSLDILKRLVDKSIKAPKAPKRLPKSQKRKLPPPDTAPDS